MSMQNRQLCNNSLFVFLCSNIDMSTNILLFVAQIAAIIPKCSCALSLSHWLTTIHWALIDVVWVIVYSVVHMIAFTSWCPSLWRIADNDSKSATWCDAYCLMYWNTEGLYVPTLRNNIIISCINLMPVVVWTFTGFKLNPKSQLAIDLNVKNNVSIHDIYFLI